MLLLACFASAIVGLSLASLVDSAQRKQSPKVVIYFVCAVVYIVSVTTLFVYSFKHYILGD